VKAGEGNQWLLSKRYNQTPLSETLKNELEELKTVAFLVVKNDSIIYEQYQEGYSDSSLSNSFSMAKSIVGVLAGIALEEGKIKIDQPVSDFLPEFRKGDKGKITIRHLLTMSSGLNWWETYISPISHTTEAYYGTDLPKLINKLKVEKEPGTEFRYNSGDPQILSFVLEAATGKKLSDYASEKLWQPIGAVHDALWNLDKEDGKEKAYCCFYSNARDFARLGKLYLNKGSWNDRQVVPEHYVERSVSPIGLNNTDGKPVDYYGYLWWLLPDSKYPVFYARGILGQFIIVIPEKRLIIVRLGHKQGKKINNHPQEVYIYVDEVLATF